MQNMSKRDRNLLMVVLTVLVIVLVGYYVIIPTNKNNKTLAADIETAETKWAEMEEKVIKLPAVRKQYEDRLEEYAEAVAYFYEPMESQAIDRMLTGIVLEREMFCDSLSINITGQPLSLRPYVHSDIYSSKSGKFAKLSGISCANLRLQVWGSREQCQELIDFMILQNPAIRLTGYRWDYNSIVTRDKDGVVVESYDVLTMNMELYMYEARG